MPREGGSRVIELKMHFRNLVNFSNLGIARSTGIHDSTSLIAGRGDAENAEKTRRNTKSLNVLHLLLQLAAGMESGGDQRRRHASRALMLTGFTM